MTSDTFRNLVIALVAQNENQALSTYSEGMGLHYTKLGYEFRIINLYDQDGSKELITALKSDQVAFVYGFAGVGSQLSIGDGTNLWTVSKTPFAALWFDHPCYNFRQHMVDSPYVLHIYHVRDHLEARIKHLPSSSSSAILLTIPYKPNPFAAEKPFNKRERCILFPKTVRAPVLWEEDWKKHPRPLQDVLWALAEQARKDRNMDLADAAKSMIFQQGLPPNDIALFMDAVQEVDAYIRNWRCDLLARALLTHPAKIVGRGWEYLAGETSRAKFMPPIPALEFLLSAPNYKIIANTNPLWRDGIHERVGVGISSGCVTLTDRTVKSDEAFSNLPNYVGFEWRDDLEDAVREALRRADIDGDEYLAASHKVLTNYYPPNAYDEYVMEILKSAEMIRIRNSS